MKTVVFLYNTSCIYEIVILNYFLKFTGRDVLFASPDGRKIIAMEGYSINVNCAVGEIDAGEVELLVVPGGNIREIDHKETWNLITAVRDHNGMIAGICAGVDVLDHAGILNGIDSTHSTDMDVAVSGNIITSRANGYVDFAIEVAKKMNLFESEEDLQETIAFWRDYQRMQ